MNIHQPLKLPLTEIIKAPRPRLKRRGLKWRRVNEFTWALFNPQAARVQVSAAKGKWAGYRQSQTLAWVFDIGQSAPDWRVRYSSGSSWRSLGRTTDLWSAKYYAEQYASSEAGRRARKPRIRVAC